MLQKCYFSNTNVTKLCFSKILVIFCNVSMVSNHRALKQTETNHQSKSFSDFFQLMEDELISKSEEASKIMRFPRIPYYNEDFICLANLLSKNFDRSLVEFDGTYFITDPSIACTFHQKRKGFISSFLKRNLTKILNGENSSMSLKRFSCLHNKIFQIMFIANLI